MLRSLTIDVLPMVTKSLELKNLEVPGGTPNLFGHTELYGQNDYISLLEYPTSEFKPQHRHDCYLIDFVVVHSAISNLHTN